MGPPSSHPSYDLRLDRWTVAMTDLLNVCTEKLRTNPKGAEEFQMEGGLPMIQRSYEIERSWPKILAAGVAGFFTTAPRRNPTLYGSSWYTTRRRKSQLTEADRDILLSPAARSTSGSTQKFKISCNALLHPPLCEWTYQFISSTRLTSFVLENLIYYSYYWGIIFSWLTPMLQHLEDLTIRNCKFIRPRALAKLLQNLPHLKQCHIDLHLHTKKRQVVSCDLPPNLTTFIAPSEFIHLIRPKGLQAREQRFKKPGPLTTLRVVVSCKNDPCGYHRGSCQAHMKEILQTYSGVPWIILDTHRCSENYYSRLFVHCEQRSWVPGREEKLSDIFSRSVKELVMSEDHLRWIMMWNAEGISNLFGMFKGVKVVIMGTATATKTEWVSRQELVLGLLKSACGSLEMIKLKGAEQNLVTS
ncbi:hypothetical protein BDN72DRAFT_916255 [Pluteus cervinus]|uniref:Uncharacterized protein n=1 Tax=Pluteus cervinus TaxID=181527 RepID=A0ACD3AMR7_9AGAR|nr:hypothetical protein BDN72DRAFT_916255 [Pluteus cervinus]